MKKFITENYELREGYSDIYRITNKINGISYIGKAKHFLGKRLEIHGAYHRFNNHIRKCNEYKESLLTNTTNNACSKLYNAFIKYNIDNFEINVLCVCKTEYENVLEILLIKEHKTYWEEGGYNLTKGSDGISGYKHTPEAIEKIRQANLGENNHFYGKSLSQAHKDKISESNKGVNHHFYGKTFSDEYKQKLSDSHKGENHHFYGLTFSDEHKVNLGKSISKTRRDYNDEQFINLLRMKKLNKKIQDITDDFRKENNSKIDRNSISKIWSGKILPINEDLMNTEEYKSLILFERKKRIN
jgi:group I intron endonuclease